MVAKSKNKDRDWEKLVKSLKKGFAEMEKERKTGKKESLTAVQVVCSQEDIDRTRQGWDKKKKR